MSQHRVNMTGKVSRLCFILSAAFAALALEQARLQKQILVQYNHSIVASADPCTYADLACIIRLFTHVNGKWCIYIVPLSKALYILCITFTHSHTFIHRWRRKPRKAPTCSTRGSGSCSRTLQHYNSVGTRDRTGNTSGILCVQSHCCM